MSREIDTDELCSQCSQRPAVNDGWCEKCNRMHDAKERYVENCKDFSAHRRGQIRAGARTPVGR